MRELEGETERDRVKKREKEGGRKEGVEQNLHFHLQKTFPWWKTK